EGLQDRLADPPDGIGDELDALRLVEFVGGANESEVALVDEIGEGDALVLILLRHRDDKAQVGANERVQGLLVIDPDSLRQLDLILPRDQRIDADIAEVLVQRAFLVGGSPAFRRCHAAGCSLVADDRAGPHSATPAYTRAYSTRSPIRCHRTRVRSG